MTVLSMTAQWPTLTGSFHLGTCSEHGPQHLASGTGVTGWLLPRSAYFPLDFLPPVSRTLPAARLYVSSRTRVTFSVLQYNENKAASSLGGYSIYI